MRGDKHKEELQSYYKLTEDDMEEIIKEWPAEFLVPVDQAELSDPTSSKALWSLAKNIMHPTIAGRKRRKRYRN
jgi:hypothetical protein